MSINVIIVVKTAPSEIVIKIIRNYKRTILLLYSCVHASVSNNAVFGGALS